MDNFDNEFKKIEKAQRTITAVAVSMIAVYALAACGIVSIVVWFFIMWLGRLP